MRFVALIGLVHLAACATANNESRAGADADLAGADAAADASHLAPDATPDARALDAFVPDAFVPDACAPVAETCDGRDDDCDGRVDEAFPVGMPCSLGLGACARTGTFDCTADGTGTQCNAVAGAPERELCGNGVDEDCNGADAACPSNDLPAGAIDISAGGTFTVDLTAAHDDNWAPSSPQFDCGDMGGRDAFYQFTLPAEEVVYFDSFGSDFDSVIRVYAGACTALGTLEACADDACHQTRSQGAVDLPAGQYCLVVDQFADTTTAGAAKLTFRRGGRPGTVIDAATGSLTGTNATGAINRSTASCEANSPQPDVGYAFLACPGTTTVDVNLCTGTTYDAVLYVRQGAATSADVACGDDECSLQPKIVGAAVAGPNLGWFIVDGWGSGASGKGSYTLTYTFH